jgi:thioredoxin 2
MLGQLLVLDFWNDLLLQQYHGETNCPDRERRWKREPRLTSKPCSAGRCTAAGIKSDGYFIEDQTVSCSLIAGGIMADAQLIRCPSCDATNRVPAEKLAQGLEPVCGRCKTPLLAANKPLTVTDASFRNDVERASLPVLLDLWAPWCGPCRTIAPVIEELAREMVGRVKVAKLNVDENPATAARFNVMSIPTLLILKGGREVERIVGVQPKSEIVRRLERAAA